MKKEVDGFFKVLFGNKFTSLSDFIEKYKAESPSNLKEYFNNGKSKYAEELKQFSAQQALINAIISKLFGSSTTTSERLAIAFDSLENLKPFLI